MEIGLSLGSNLGERLGNLTLARQKVAADRGIRVVAQSPVYETEPVDVRSEHKDRQFLNAVLIVESETPPNELLARLHQVECELGRRRVGDRNAPRTVDIDILYVGDRCRADSLLTVPHPRWTTRRFVVQPLADVRPDLILPGEQRTVSQVLLSLPQSPIVVLFSREW